MSSLMKHFASRFPHAAAETALARYVGIVYCRSARFSVNGNGEVLASETALYVRANPSRKEVRQGAPRELLARAEFGDIDKAWVRSIPPDPNNGRPRSEVVFLWTDGLVKFVSSFTLLNPGAKWLAARADVIDSGVDPRTYRSFAFDVVQRWETAVSGDPVSSGALVGRVFDTNPWLADDVYVQLKIAGYRPDPTDQREAAELYMRLERAIKASRYPAMRKAMSGSSEPSSPPEPDFPI